MRRLLIVDDDPSFRHAVRTVVDLDGNFEVVGEAGTGREAVELVSRLLPEVVVIDYAMPVTDGLEACLQIHEHWPWVHVVMLTGSRFDGGRETEIRSHVALLLTKEQFDPGTLARALLDA